MEFLVIGKTIRKIEARSAREALGLNPDAINAVPYKKTVKKITPLDLSIVATDLETMLTSGLSLSEALDGIISSKNDYTVMIFFEIKTDILSGLQFSTALAKRKETPPLFAESVRAGEDSGQLPQVLRTLAVYYRTIADVHSKIGLALIMPVATIIATAVVFIYMLNSLFPQLRSFAKDAGITKFTGVTNFFFMLSNNIILVAIVVAAFVILFIKYKDTIMRYLPFVGKAYILLDAHMDIFLIASVLNLVLTAGTKVQQAFNYIIPSIKSKNLKEALKQAQDRVKKGSSLAESFYSPSVPGAIRNVVEVGERSGKLPVMFEKLAVSMVSNIDNDVKVIENSMPIALTLILGVVVFALLGTFYYTYFAIIAQVMGGMK